jgi:hypothetical protein
MNGERGAPRAFYDQGVHGKTSQWVLLVVTLQ